MRISPSLEFALPSDLEASAPPEARGVARDRVRLLVDEAGEPVRHVRFDELADHLLPGDLLVLNNSATLPARLTAVADDGAALIVHLSTRLGADRWTVELRRPTARGHEPLRTAGAGARLALPGGARLRLDRPYGAGRGDGVRLWEATLRLPPGAAADGIADPAFAYLARHGAPISYGHTEGTWPLAAYQTVLALEPGSAEMPSAARAFTPELLADVLARGIGIAVVTLHTGVSSLEDHEPPYPEPFAVAPLAAETVNAAHRVGGRVIAVGTTVVRALESATGPDGRTVATEGWTDLVVTPDRPLRAVDGLLTGLHEPRASHLLMLEAVAGRRRLVRAYEEALRERYLWHEFGDLHLILPAREPATAAQPLAGELRSRPAA
jgi:S-adenosylmethionine:tRNA ribosyltransferase-isomerase